MIKVNLISKKSHAYKGRNWTKIISYILFGSLSLYFISATLYVVISIGIINKKIADTKKASTAISEVMLANNDQLSRFVLSKLILSKIESINAGKFPYKDYLDQVSTMLPAGSLLSSVDFSTRGWIAVSVNSTDIGAFKLLEKSLINKDVWVDNKFFSGAYIENVIKEKSGSYSTRLQLELKTING